MTFWVSLRNPWLLNLFPLYSQIDKNFSISSKLEFCFTEMVSRFVIHSFFQIHFFWLVLRALKTICWVNNERFAVFLSIEMYYWQSNSFLNALFYKLVMDFVMACFLKSCQWWHDPKILCVRDWHFPYSWSWRISLSFCLNLSIY